MSAATANLASSPLNALGSAECDALIAHLRPLLGHGGDAEDMAQETIVRALEKRALYDPARPVIAWLKSIATNLATDVLRRRARVRFRSIEAATDLPAPPAAAPAAGLGALPARALGAAIEALPESERCAIRLFYDERRTIPEIAERLGAPAGTVKSWLHRGRERLRAHLLAAVSHAAAVLAVVSLGAVLALDVPTHDLSRGALYSAAADRAARAPVDVDRVIDDLGARRATFAALAP